MFKIMPKIVWNGGLRHYDTLRSEDAIGDLIYFSILLGDVHVWPRQFWLEQSLRLTCDSDRQHQCSLAARRVCARLSAGTYCSASPWEPCWIQHFSRGESFHCVLVPTPLWGKGQIYIMKQSQVREKGSCLIQETNKLWRLDWKSQMFPWE